MTDFEGNEFQIQALAKGSFIDNGTGDGEAYLVETTAIRLNWVALNAWLQSETLNCRDCYETDEEWASHKAEYAEKRKSVTAKILSTLDIDANTGSVCITQSLSEVFAVVHIRKMPRHQTVNEGEVKHQ